MEFIKRQVAIQAEVSQQLNGDFLLILRITRKQFHVDILTGCGVESVLFLRLPPISRDAHARQSSSSGLPTTGSHINSK